jgi:hypothetical protein
LPEAAFAQILQNPVTIADGDWLHKEFELQQERIEKNRRFEKSDRFILAGTPVF